MLTLILGGVALLLLLVYSVYMSRNHGLFRRMGIPGPRPWPVVGNFLSEAKQGIIAYHISLYNQHRGQKVYGFYRGDTGYLVVRDLDMVRDIYVKNFNQFPNREHFFEEEPLNRGLTDAKDDHWKNIRKTISPAFNAARLRRMYKHIKTNTQKLTDFLRDKQERNEPIELKNMFSLYTMDVIASTGFGMQTDCLSNPSNQFMTQAKHLLSSLGRVFLFKYFLFFLRPFLSLFGVTGIPRAPLDYFVKFVDAAIDIRKETVQSACGADRKLSTHNDFLNLMLDAETDQPSDHNDNMTSEEAEVLSTLHNRQRLTKPDIQGQALLFIIAGFDTAATAMSFTLFLLAIHPDCLHKAQKEVDSVLEGEFPDYDSVQKLTYLDMCLLEAMRCYSPAFLTDRQCKTETVVQGVRIPAGQTVVFPLCAIHRDPDLWPEPDKFIPERFTPENKAKRHPYAHMPFGYGPRQCVGMRLGQLEMRVAMAAVLQRFSPVACDKTVFPINIQPFKMAAKDGLWVRLEAR